MDKLIKDAKHYSKYNSSTMSNVNFTIIKQIYSAYSKNLHYMRGTFMMNMFISQQNTDFFDIPSAPSLFQSVYMKVSSTLVNYPAMFIQGLAAKIQSVYEHPFEFAANVDLFFQEDITDLIVFAYSTFPALYSFFLTEEFCSSASSFLIAIFKSSRNQLLSELLLSSFFISGTVFFDHFIFLIGDHLFELTSKKNDLKLPSKEDNNQSNQKKKIFKNIFKLKANNNNDKSNDDKPTDNQNVQNIIKKFFPFFINSLKTCLPLLSQYHIKAFRSFSKIFPHNAHKFFLQKVLLQPFQTAAESSISLVSSEGNKFFMSFLNILSDYPQDDPLIQTLMSTILNIATNGDDINDSNNDNEDEEKNPNFHEVYPSLKGFVWNHGVPLLLSHIDIKLFVDLLKFTKIFDMDNSSFAKLKVNFRDSFDTISFNVFPSFCAMNSPEQGIGIDLFGEMPPSLSASVQNYKELIEEQKAKEKNASNDNDNNNNNDNNNDSDSESECDSDTLEAEKAALIDSNKKRIFRQVINYANEESLDLTELILNPPKKFSMLKGDISYVLLLLNSFHNNFITTEQTILTEEAKKLIRTLIMSTRELIHVTYHHFSFSFLKERIKSISDVVPAIRELINSDSESDSNSGSNSNLTLKMSSSSVADSDLLLAKAKVNTAFLSTDELPFQKPSENRLLNSVIFEISLTALDALKLHEGTVKIEAAEADFEDELMMWIMEEWPSYKENEIFQRRNENIKNISQFLKHVQKGGYGRRLKIIINFVKSLKRILTSDNLHLWKPAFKYAVFCSSQKQIFSTFLYIYHYIIMRMKLDEILDSEIQNLISMFTVGMWSILDNNLQLNIKYADFNIAKQIFES